jgi:outer membrane receptor protein involved in Fe transport
VFWQTFSQNLENYLPACGPVCSQDGTDPQGITFASAETSTHDQVFKFNTSYKLSPETTTYLTIAQGYRHGGANALCATPTASAVCYSTADAAPLIPYKPDKALNYEIGIKGTDLAHRLQYSVGLYRIDWKNIQLETFSPVTGTTLIVNGETARSQGVEAEITLQPADNLSLTFGYAYNDSKLTAHFINGSFVGRDGDRLPYVSGNTASLALDYFQPVRGMKGIGYHLDAAYRSNMATRLNDCDVENDAPRCPAPPNANGGPTGYGVLDGFTVLNASFTLEMNDQWSFRAYGVNLTNELGITATSLTSALDRNNREYVMRPRTFGVEARYQFK